MHDIMFENNKQLTQNIFPTYLHFASNHRFDIKRILPYMCMSNINAY